MRPVLRLHSAQPDRGILEGVTHTVAGVDDLETFRHELTGYCYRMLGSLHEAEDAVQETIIRAWKALDSFEGRSSLRSWVYRIATNVCMDQLRGAARKAVPMDLGGPALSPADPGGVMESWLEPAPDGRVVDPADAAVSRESVRLAFLAALQHLPPGQRAVLLLREVLCFSAAEVAELIGMSVPAVNSSLQRARAVMARRSPARAAGDAESALLSQYVDAFQRGDTQAVTMLMHMDAVLSLAPHKVWLRGPAEILAWWDGPALACRGSRLIPVSANGRPAFGQYRPNPAGDGFHPWALQVVETADGRITALHSFLDNGRLFALFGLPASLPG